MIFERIIRIKKAVLAAFVLFTLFCLAGTIDLKITPDNRVFYGADNAQFNQFLEFESNYTPNNNISFVVDLKESFEEPRHAEAIRWLTNRVWAIPNVIRVDSLATYPDVTGTADFIEVNNLLDTACPVDQTLTELEPDGYCVQDATDLLNRKHLINRLVSEDFSAIGVVATLAIDIGALGLIETISADAENAADQFEGRFPEFEIVVTGGVPMMAAFATSSENDLALLLPTAFVLILVLLTIFFGGVRPALILAGLGIVSAICTIGISGWLGMTVNSATAIVPLVVFTIVVTSSMHITIHFLRTSAGRTSPADIGTAVKAALEGNLSPMLVSATTSIVGLLSLSFVDSPPLRELGQLSALGVFIGITFSLLVLPILLSGFRSGYVSTASAAIQQALNEYARYLETKKSPALVSFLVLLLTLIGLLRLEINDDFVDYFDHRTEFRVATDRATELLSGPNHIEVLLGNPFESGVFDPSYIQYLERLTNFLRDQPLVSSVAAYSDVLDELSRAFGKSTTEVETAEEFAQWNLAYELSLVRGQSNTDFIRADQQESRVSILLSRTTSKQIQALETSIVEWHENQGTQFALTVTGENIPVAHLSELNIRSMIGGLGVSIALVTLLIGYLVKRVRLGLVALAGTLAPLAFGFGVWGLLGNNIGLASTAIIALTVGVVIDDAVHMLYRFVDGRDRLRLDSWRAAAYSVHRAGTAIATTSVVMVGGLSVLLLSSFKINSSFGAVTCLIIALALLFDLLVLPRLLIWADPQK